MSRRLSVIWAVLLKDLRLLWPMAALTVTLILARSLYDGHSEVAIDYLPFVAALAAAFFVLGLVHQDAPASLRHDWLTRPIGEVDLVAAKAALAALVVLLPSALGPAIAAARDGASAPEAIMSAFAAAGSMVTIGFGLLVIAAITASFLEAAGVMVGLFLVFLFGAPLARGVSGVTEVALYTGTGWVVLTTLGVIMVIGGLVVLYLQYAGRRTGAARAAFAGAVGVMAIAVALLNWDALFAVQKAVSRDDPAADGAVLALAPGCFETTTVDPGPRDVEFPTDGPWTGDDRRTAGFGAVGFWTTVEGRNLPDGWRMSFTHAQANFVDAKGGGLHRMQPARIMPVWRTAPDGRLEARHAWLVSRARLNELSRRAAGVRLDYKLALLAPAQVAELPADGRERRIEGLGSCAANARPGAAVNVTCFVAGRQPDLLAARLTDAAPDQEIAGKFPDFAPDVLQLSAGKRYQMILPRPAGAGPARVRITAYEARAHLTRSVTAPGLLGGPACARAAAQLP